MPAPGADLSGEVAVVGRLIQDAAADELDQALVGTHQRVGDHPGAQVAGLGRGVLGEEGPLGFVLPRQAWMARHRPGELAYDSFGLAEVQARVHGEAAVVTARNNTIGSYQGHPIPEATRATLVLVRGAGHWQLAAAHMSFLAGTRGAPPVPGAGQRAESHGRTA